MEIKLSPEESEQYFHNALCNGLGEFFGYGLDLEYEPNDYRQAKKDLETMKHPWPWESKTGSSIDLGICNEDVLMQILHNGKILIAEDIEGQGDMTRSIKLKDVHDRVLLTPITHLTDMIEENDDAITADAILQTVFFEKLIFS